MSADLKQQSKFNSLRPRASSQDDSLNLNIRKLELTLDRRRPELPTRRASLDRWATIDGDDERMTFDQPSKMSSMSVLGTDQADRPRSWWNTLLGGGRQQTGKDKGATKDSKLPSASLKRPVEGSSVGRGSLDDPQSPLKRSNSPRPLAPVTPAWPARFTAPRWKLNATHPALTPGAHSNSAPSIFINSRGSSATEFGSEGRASLDGSPPSSLLSHAALNAFRNEEIQSLSGVTLFGDSEGELHAAIQRSQKNGSNSELLPLPPRSPAKPAASTAPAVAVIKPSLKLAIPPLDNVLKLPPVPTASTKESEDKERNTRHLEVVELQNGIRKLPGDFRSKFEIGELLGDGAFGFVMTAKSLASGKEVAVKFILREKIATDLWTSDPLLGRLPLEVSILSQLHHPNIIRYLTHYTDSDRFILVTELHGTQWHSDNPELNPMRNPGLLKVTPAPAQFDPSGKSDCSPLHRLTPEQEKNIRRRVPCDLFQCIDAHSRLPDNICRHIFAQIALAVHYMHSMGFVHRDLKDENVVVDADYNVKLIDFGSAAAIPSRIEQYFTYSKFNGTMHFASPEICKRQPYRGPEAEVWSLGVLLYIIVFAESPFQTKADTIKGDFVFPRTEHDPKCADLISKMLTYDESKRIKIDQIIEHEWVRKDVEKLRAKYASVEVE